MRPRVVIVGAGFGGLRAARVLGGQPVDVLVLDRHNYHLFQPLLYQVATAAIDAEDIAYPLRRIFSQHPNLEFRLADVKRVALDAKCVETDAGPVAYDNLILAAGSENNYFGLEHIARFGKGLKNLRQAVELRNHVLRCLERAEAADDAQTRQALLTIAVGGGGATGVEVAGALSELVRTRVPREYHNVRAAEVRLIIIEGGPELLAMVGRPLRNAALRELQRKRVEVRLKTLVKDYDGHTLLLSDGQKIETNTLVWAAGVSAAALAAAVGLRQVRGGRLPVMPTLQVRDHADAYVIGDLAYLEQDGTPLPQLAPVAVQQGQHAAENILRQVGGLKPTSFRYRHRGTMATIGSSAAVAEIGKVRVSGAPGWALWLLIHIVLLIGFRNRVMVLINWAWNYINHERVLGLITDC